MTDEPEVKKKVPDRCRIDPSTGDVFCPSDMKQDEMQLKNPSIDEHGAVFTTTRQRYKKIRCDTNRKTNQFECDMKSVSDRQPEA